jgi:lipoprotein-anchoring transpeptidase ErfK/SrfK
LGFAVIRVVLSVASLVAALAVSVAALSPAQADILIAVDKSTQRMTVAVDGRVRHVWTVSTGTHGGPPSGNFRPQRMHRKYFSRTYDWAPMPHSIFFHHGFAIHGTDQLTRLGRRASKGCVRLHPRNAALLFDMVKQRGMARTRIVISDRQMIAVR